MRLEIRYATTFVYPRVVVESHNALRACPSDGASQRVASYTVTVTPPARLHSYADYWGTRVDAFGIREPHDALVVVADSVVETGPAPAPSRPAPFAAFRDPAFVEAHHQYLVPTAHTRWGPEIEAAATAVVDPSGTTHDAVAAVHDAVGAHLSYVPGATFVGMDVTDVYAAGKGVCQDFVHLALAMYRSAGIPARYVSGYFYAADRSVGEAPAEAEVAVQTHAWLEVAMPDGSWWPLDPTNPVDVGERHVKIGHGRDYDDVPPLRGVYHGAVEHRLGVDVRISREGLAAYQRDEEMTFVTHRSSQQQHQQQQQQQ